uniref:Myelin and lymphocyte protein n=1 Tax=Esox lucius TaxID=8010 RepID=C1BX33_ESOLU|nr:Myelin and lymphocyte protein [Esox lucius]
MASSTNPLPSGCSVLISIPDFLFIPEFVFGGLVWTLVASTKVLVSNPLGWVMFVTVFCFIFTTLWFFIFITGGNKSSSWPTLDVAHHALAAFFYLSASVLLAFVTIGLKDISDIFPKEYGLDIAAVVMSFTVTLFYTLHAVPLQ